MTPNTSQESIMAQRREMVARLRLRGLSQREICHALSHPTKGMINPQTNKPYSIATINADCQFLVGQWQETMMEHEDTRLSRIWAEIQEIRREAWKTGDLSTLMRAIKQEIDLFGLEAPKRQELTGAGGGPIALTWQEAVKLATQESEAE
jgi:hypothetical protein